MKIISLILHILVGINFLIAQILPVVTGSMGLYILLNNPGARGNALMIMYSVMVTGSMCFFAAAVSIVFGVVALIRNKRVTFYTVFEIINSVYGMVSALSFLFIRFVVFHEGYNIRNAITYVVPVMFILLFNIITLAFAIINRIRVYNEPEEDDGYAYSSQDGMRYDSQIGAQYGMQPESDFSQFNLQADPGDEYSR